MKTKMIVILCGVILIVAIVILNHFGIITWQKMTIVFAAVLAPLRHLTSWLKSPADKIKEIEESHADMRKQEGSFRKSSENELAKNKEKLDDLNQQITTVNVQKETLDTGRLKANEILKNLSDEELLAAVKKTLAQQ